jgi:hypothetical protein
VEKSNNGAFPLRLEITQQQRDFALFPPPRLPRIYWFNSFAHRKIGELRRAYAAIGRIYLARTLIYQGRLALASVQLQTGIIQDQRDHNKEAELLEPYLWATTALMQGNPA